MDDFLAVLTSVSRAVKTHLEGKLLTYGVHAGQQFILESLWREDGLTPGELAQRIGVETPTVTRAAQRMEVTGLVRRIPDPDDARLVRVYLTERGREVQKLLPTMLGSATEEVLAGLTQEERTELVRLLKRVQKNLLEEG
jgi:MarR family transcriptional regulator, organic hydroperoxide resistance regulator